MRCKGWKQRGDLRLSCDIVIYSNAIFSSLMTGGDGIITIIIKASENTNPENSHSNYKPNHQCDSMYAIES